MNFLGQGFQESPDMTYRQTQRERETDATKRITTPHSRVVKIQTVKFVSYL